MTAQSQAINSRRNCGRTCPQWYFQHPKILFSCGPNTPVKFLRKQSEGLGAYHEHTNRQTNQQTNEQTDIQTWRHLKEMHACHTQIYLHPVDVIFNLLRVSDPYMSLWPLSSLSSSYNPQAGIGLIGCIEVIEHQLSPVNLIKSPWQSKVFRNVNMLIS